jgi:hypothetical protein
MFDELPSLVIERIQDYLFPFALGYLKFRSLSSDFKNLIDQVIDETPTEDSINFRLWVIFLHQGCLPREQKRSLEWHDYHLSFNFYHSIDFEGANTSLSVLSLRGKYELRIIVTNFSLDCPYDLSLIDNKIVISFTNCHIKFDFIRKTTKVCYQSFPINLLKINLTQGYSFWFYHNDYVFAMDSKDGKNLLIIDKNYNQSVIKIPFDCYESEHIRFGLYPLIFQRTRTIFQGFDPLTQKLCGHRFSRYRKWVYIGSNDKYDCFSARNIIHAFSRRDSVRGIYQLKFFYFSKKFMVLSDRIMFSLLTVEKRWEEVFFVDFNWEV